MSPSAASYFPLFWHRYLDGNLTVIEAGRAVIAAEGGSVREV